MGAIQRPGNEVVDQALPWIDQHRGSAVLRLDPSLRRAHAVQSAGAVPRAATPAIPYQGEISFADSQVGRVVQFLRDRKLLDRTVIVVIGDHGESLKDHGEERPRVLRLRERRCTCR